MSAGLGSKTFVSGDVLTAADVNGYLMQGVLVFASAAARTSAIASPQEGQYSYLKDTNVTEYYSGSAWVSAGGTSPGLVQIGSKTTFTAASGVNVNSCFSATYNRYLVLLKVKAATGGVRCYVKLRASGTDASAGYYYTFLDSVYSGAAPTNTGANNVTTGWPTVVPTTGYTTGGAFTFYSPFEAATSLMTQHSMSVDAGGLATQGGGVLLDTTSYDGFSLVFASGTYTGELVVYGYSN